MSVALIEARQAQAGGFEIGSVRQDCVSAPTGEIDCELNQSFAIAWYSGTMVEHSTARHGSAHGCRPSYWAAS